MKCFFVPSNIVEKTYKMLLPTAFVSLLIGSEWLFQITKPSFFTAMGTLDTFFVLLFSTSTFLVLLGLPLLLMMLISSAFGKSVDGVAFFLVSVISGLVIATLILLMIDNFTHTILRFGINTSTVSWKKFGYLTFWILLIIHFSKSVFKINKISKKIQWGLIPCVFLTMIGIVLMASNFNRNIEPIVGEVAAKQANNHNIVILSSDGVEATNMSIYGYERDTTPFLQSISNELLISENSFVNNANTTGSIISLLTGVLPTTSHVTYPPDVLKGVHAFRHWPGIMLRNGYKTMDVSVRKFADAFDLNLREGFLEANFRSTATGTINNVVPKWYQHSFSNTAYFIQLLIDKIVGVVSHILFIKNMVNPYAEVAQDGPAISDRMRIDAIKQYALSNKKFFINAHLMGTHGPKFKVDKVSNFSKGKSQDENWAIDFYDDAILRFDRYVEEIYRFLEEENLLEKTILIVHSDHGIGWKDGVRIPLIFRFPQKAYSGKFSSNTQSIDIAPTILDMINIEVPNWMEGRNILSLIQQEEKSSIPIFSASVTKVDCGVKGGCAVVEPDPEFGTIGDISVVVCGQYFQLKLRSGEVRSKIVKGYTGGPCPTEGVLNKAQAAELMVKHLADQGYDVSRKALLKYHN